MGKKYYEHYEDIYKAALAAGVDRFNNPLEGRFDNLFLRCLLPAGGRVLDLGCGEGLYALLFAVEGYDVTGIDRSPSAVGWAQKRADSQGAANAHFLVGDITALDELTSEQFDIVLSIHCYHCLSDAKDRIAHLREAWRMLRPGGVFVFDNMAAPRAMDMPKFRAWHEERGAQVEEDDTGVATRMDFTPPMITHQLAGSESIRIEAPSAVALAHRFYCRMAYIQSQLTEVGFKILDAKERAPDPFRVPEMNFVQGDNVLYARK